MEQQDELCYHDSRGKTSGSFVVGVVCLFAIVLVVLIVKFSK